MARNSSRSAKTGAALTLLVAVVIVSGCDRRSPDSASIGTDAATDTSPLPPRSRTSAVATDAQRAASRSGRELLNPDDSTMVLLYYYLAGIAPLFDQWVEKDSRVQFARPMDRAALRTSVRSELEAARASLRDVASIRLSMHANLSDYDPTYGEFTVRALAPSSVVEYSAFGEKVALRFTNGRTAQIWRVPAAQAQTLRDRIGAVANVDLDVLLNVEDAIAGPAGGTLNTVVSEYELRQSRGGALLGRVQITP